MDLSAFYARRREDGWGRAAFDPKVMICLLLYCYSGGERSSRKIERRSKEDVACRFITANHTPDHSTIARFHQSHEGGMPLAGLRIQPILQWFSLSGRNRQRPAFPGK